MDKAAILIVDDEFTVRTVLEEILRNKKYEIHLAKDGQEGLEKFRELSPDVVLLDLNMPIKDGFAFLEELKPKPEDDFEVIVISGNTENPTIVKSYDLGAASLLRKPFFAAEVRRVVQHSLHRKEMEAKLKTALKKTDGNQKSDPN
jgi:CheY-like chemotaxis protein